jgi:hypothetical protein
LKHKIQKEVDHQIASVKAKVEGKVHGIEKKADKVFKQAEKAVKAASKPKTQEVSEDESDSSEDEAAAPEKEDKDIESIRGLTGTDDRKSAVKKRSTDGEVKRKVQGKAKKHEVEKMEKIEKIAKKAS